MTECCSSPAGMCLDLRFCLGFCGGERFLRLWNLASRINDQTLTYNTHKTRSDGTVEVIPMGTPSRWVVKAKGIHPFMTSVVLKAMVIQA